MEHDVFICYSSRDKGVADAVCAALESDGIRCWMAPRDVLHGIPYAEAIVIAIKSCSLMVLVFSESANVSGDVLREVHLAVKHGRPIIPFRIKDVPLSDAMEYYISVFQWLDALTPPWEQHLGRLKERALSMLSRPALAGLDGEIHQPKRTAPGGAQPPKSRGRLSPGQKRTFAGFEMIWCPPGEFLMGSPAREANRDDDERCHPVVLSRGFWLGKYPVTQEQWELVMGSNPSRFTADPRLPVERVSWNDCQDFLRYLNADGAGEFRLPTEAEWEYACRAGSATAYCFGDDAAQLGHYAWYSDNANGQTAPLGQLKPNAWNLHDMHGNVCEWCQDWYGVYPDDTITDPSGPGSSRYRVLRGGTWYGGGGECRSASRGNGPAGFQDDQTGLRLLRNP